MRSLAMGLRFTVALVIASGWLCAHLAQARPEQKTIWSGVYTDAQATKGQAIYVEFCSGCHSFNLEGGAFEGAPPLKGDRFMESWREDSLQSMFTKIITTMPRRNASKVLTEEETLNVMSYIFKVNEFPAGAELNTAVLKDIQVERKDGPKPLPNYAKIQLVGCMAADGENWILANATAPSRNRNTDKLTPEDLKAAKSKPLGSLKFRLANLLMLGDFKPEAHKGQKMLAAGILIKQGNSERVSVTELEVVDSTCATSN